MRSMRKKREKEQDGTEQAEAGQELFGRLDPERAAIRQYWERAGFTYQNANVEGVDPTIRTMLTAFCVHACEALREKLEALSVARAASDPDLAILVKALPFSPLIQHVRNHDLHGNPIPVCDLKADFVIACSGKKPMQSISSHGVGVTVQMPGARPEVHLSPKDQKHGKFSPGDAISYQCHEGILGVHDFSKNKTYKLMGVLREQIVALQPIVARILDSQPSG